MSWMPDFGDLTIEKVTRDSTGRQNPGSLVFRIRRITCKRTDDSGIKSPSTDEASGNEQQENSTSPQNTNIPRTLLASDDNNIVNNIDDDDEETESGISECNSPEDLTACNKAVVENPLNNGTGIQDEDTATMDADSVSTVSETEVPRSYELRRSSRRILLRLQKECQQDLPVTKSPRIVHKEATISTNKDRQLGPTLNVRKKRGKKPGRPDSSVNRAPRTIYKSQDVPFHNDVGRLHPILNVRKKRGRKPGRPAAEVKKRKYMRRGRPSKSMLQSNLSITNPVVTGSNQKENDRIMPQPSKNTVWTLVPKELFESEFFKSQVLKVRYSNPVDGQNFLPSTITRQVPCPPSTRIQLKFPRIVVNSVPVLQQKVPDDKSNKRPTVIYFKKSSDENLPPNRQPDLNRHLHFNNYGELAKPHNDLLYLFNKYRMLDPTVVKNYYVLTRCDVNETDCLLTDLLSKSPVASPEPQISDPQSNLNTCSVINPVSCDNIVHRSETPVLSSSFDVNDTLCRAIIVESMKILFSEEAVLQ